MPERQTKLHEYLAASADRAAAATANITETVGVFKGKASDLFFGNVKIKTALDAARQAELDGREDKPIQSSVMQRLDYTLDLLTKSIDVQATIAATNQIAKASIVVDNKVLAADVPVSALLDLEKQVRAVMEMVKEAPTLPTGQDWELDPSKGDNVWKTKVPRVTTHTEKQPYSLVLLSPTDKHPGQAVEKSRDVVIAKTEETQWNSMMPSLQKAQILARLQELHIAVQQARQRANETIAVPISLGSIIKNTVFAAA